jgi:hypothetical protein
MMSRFKKVIGCGFSVVGERLSVSIAISYLMGSIFSSKNLKNPTSGLLNVLGNLVLLMAVLLGSCVEKIDFPLNRGVEKLIVSGQINNLNEAQIIYLSETTSANREPLSSGNYFVINDLPRPLQGASVNVISSDGGMISFQETKPGQYEFGTSLGLKSGVDYQVEISFEGRTYRSTAESLNPVIGTDELSYTFERGIFKDQPETAFISIISTVQLPEQVGDYYLRWDVDEVYFWDLTFFPNPFNTPPPLCFVFDYPDPERITLLNGDLLNRPGGTSSQILAERIIDESFLSRHYFNVRQTSISKSSYEYWRKVRELVNNTGSVFDTPPAPIRGNIRNVNDPDEVVLGNFEVANVKLTRIYTTQADVPFFIPEVCTYSPTRRLDDYPKTCLRCSEFENSSNDYPVWWFDQ